MQVPIASEEWFLSPLTILYPIPWTPKRALLFDDHFRGINQLPFVLWCSGCSNDLIGLGSGEIFLEDRL